MGFKNVHEVKKDALTRMFAGSKKIKGLERYITGFKKMFIGSKKNVHIVQNNCSQYSNIIRNAQSKSHDLKRKKKR
jgi:hypothetical protein